MGGLVSGALALLGWLFLFGQSVLASCAGALSNQRPDRITVPPAELLLVQALTVLGVVGTVTGVILIITRLRSD